MPGQIVIQLQGLECKVVHLIKVVYSNKVSLKMADQIGFPFIGQERAQFAYLGNLISEQQVDSNCGLVLYLNSV